MKYDKLTRRMFLQSLSGALLPIPFLPSLLPRMAWAAPVDPIKRYIAISANFDYGHHAAWFPGGESQIGNMPQPLHSMTVGNGQAPIRYQALKDFAPNSSTSLSRVLGNLLNPYLDHINLIRSLDLLSRFGHGSAHIFGGSPGGNNATPSIPTIDQVLANNLKFNPRKLPVSFFGRRGSSAESLSYSASASGEAAFSTFLGPNITHLYNILFNNGNLPETGSTPGSNANKDILSQVLNDYKRVENSRYISSIDRIVLTEVADKISDTLKSLDELSTLTCSHSSLARSGFTTEIGSDPIIGKVVANIITSALMCDVTRVINFGGQMRTDYLNANAFVHQDSHTPFARVGEKRNWQLVADRQHHMIKNLLRPLLDNLSSATDNATGKSLLHNSLVHFTMESSQVHSHLSQPCLLIGNAGGHLSTGHYIDYSTREHGPVNGTDSFGTKIGSGSFSNNWNGVQYNRLFVTILQALGLSPSEYENHNLNQQLKGHDDFGEQNKFLNNIGGFGHAMRDNYADLSTDKQTRIRAAVARYNLNHFKLPLPMPPTRSS